jgi:hypothetical protein
VRTSRMMDPRVSSRAASLGPPGGVWAVRGERDVPSTITENFQSWDRFLIAHAPIRVRFAAARREGRADDVASFSTRCTSKTSW